MQKTDCDLSTCFFCQGCQPAWLELTRLKKQTFSFKKGEQLFAEGDPATGMYFMQSGIIKVHKQWGGDKELVIRFATAHDILGIRGFGDTAFRVSATVLEPAIACFIPNDHLQASLQTNPGLSYKLMQFYATELQNAEQRMNDLAHRDVKGRIATALLLLLDQFGEDDQQFLKISISRQDIASYVGTTYETLFKIFSEWTAMEWIKTEGKRIRIVERKKLESSIV